MTTAIETIMQDMDITEAVVISKAGFDAIIEQLTAEQREAIKAQFGGDAPTVTPVVLEEPEEYLYMSWSRYTDTSGEVDDWVKDYSTDAPNGIHTVRFEYLDGRYGEQFGVIVDNGEFKNPDVILELVARARNAAGYWGTFLEDLTYDQHTNRIIAHIGS